MVEMKLDIIVEALSNRSSKAIYVNHDIDVVSMKDLLRCAEWGSFWCSHHKGCIKVGNRGVEKKKERERMDREERKIVEKEKDAPPGIELYAILGWQRIRYTKA